MKQQIKFDSKIAAGFLKTIFPIIDTGYIELRYIKVINDKKKIIKIRFYKSIEMINWTEAEECNRKGFNIFYGVGLRKDKTGGTKKHISKLFYLWVDLDDKDFPGGREQIEKELKEKLPKNLYPSITVNSGHGLHLYWKLAAPVVISEQNEIDTTESYTNGLAKYLSGDSTHDISRILRIPGTINVKDSDNLIQCKIIEQELSLKYKLTDFEAYRIDSTRRTPAEPVSFLEDIPEVDLDGLKVSDRIRQLIMDGFQCSKFYIYRNGRYCFYSFCFILFKVLRIHITQ